MRLRLGIGLFVVFAGCALAVWTDRAGLKPGSLAEPWLTGGPNCVDAPNWQVHEYNEDFYILRESGCINAEKPFLYLIFGDSKALLEDTGVASDTAEKTMVPIAPVVKDLMAKWAKRKKHSPVSLVVIHSHSHGDHTAGDAQFKAMPDVQFIAAAPTDIQKAAGIANWPADIGQIDLGNRFVDVIPIPGHDVASIALYDRPTGNLMTGDSLYPGRLYVSEAQIPIYEASAKRLAAFARRVPIAHVLGTHIEQGAQPYFDYPRGTKYQPKEHVLELSRAHIFELVEAFRKMNGKPVNQVYPDFAVVARAANAQTPANMQAGTGMGLEPGEVPTGWKTGGPNCVTVPDWQVKEYNEDFYMIRESGCLNPEKPFQFLIFGDKKALLEDTGVALLMPDFTRGTVIPISPVIKDIMAKWQAKKKHGPVTLVAIHSHGHNDHTAGDGDLKTAFPDMELIEAKPAAIQKGAGIAKWPTDLGQIDLGGRIVDVIPFDGHQEASIALYDRRTGILLTGDSLYPGLLAVEDIGLYTASAKRLADFVTEHPVAHVWGTHIEQRNQPYLDFGRGTIYQIDEAPLELKRAHVYELYDGFLVLNGKNDTYAMPDFTLIPRGNSTMQYPPELRPRPAVN